MESYLVALCLVVVCVVSVQGACDEQTSNKIQQCIFNSELFNPATVPQTEAAVQSFCTDKMNVISDCMQTHLDECAGNAKEQKLLKLLVDIQAVKDGLGYMCNNINTLTSKAGCLTTVFANATFGQCLQNTMGTLQNMGEVTDVKQMFDMLCTFFDGFIGCFTTPFKGDCAAVGDIYSKVFGGVRYPYCNLNTVERQAAINEYRYGANAGDNIKMSGLLLVAVFAVFKMLS